MANKLQFLKGTSALPVSRDANNVYFKLGAAGEGQIALGDNIWNESVQIKDGDNVLAYSAADGLSASVRLSYDVDGKKIKLVGKGDANLGEIDATAFLKDGMLESASFKENKLIFVFNTDAGKTQIEVPVADLVDEYTAGNGLALSGKEFSVKLANGNESFLTVDAEGVKLSGVQSAIDTAKASAKSYADSVAAAAKTAADAAQADVDALELNVKGIDGDLSALEGVVGGHIADAVAHITAAERTAWNASEQNAKDYADSLAVKYDAAGSAATAKSEAISAAAADAAEKYQVKGNYEDAGAAATAEQNAKDYADSLAVKYDAAGSAATAKSEAISTAAADATSKANAAQAAAISTAAADATSKANTAETNAKSYADGLDSAMDARVDELESVKHSHTNKAVLDGIASSNVESWDDAAIKAHTHANKDVLDGISSDKVASWDGALASAKTYADSVAAAAQSAAETTAAADATAKANAAQSAAEATAAADATSKADAAQSAAISAAAADATSKANAAQSAAISAAATDATSKADAAQSAAISAAATDATAKANAAKTAAIADAAEKYQVKGNYETAGAADAVKDVIDAYTVNGKAISTSPVLNGSEIKLDGYALPATTSSIVVTDSVNDAIAKLEKAVGDVAAAAVKLGAQPEGSNVVLGLDASNGLTAHLEWGKF